MTSSDNGATEIPGTTYDAPLVFLGSAIRHWWTETKDGKTLHETEEFALYNTYRENVRLALAEIGFMVYSPHLALKGNWNEKVGTLINDTALVHSDAFVAIRVEDVVQAGTDHEEDQAHDHGIPVYGLAYPDYHQKFRLDALCEMLIRDFGLRS